MIDGFVLTALVIIALALVAMFPRRIAHGLAQLFWDFVFYVDAFAHDDEEEPMPEWADPIKWEASKL